MEIEEKIEKIEKVEKAEKPDLLTLKDIRHDSRVRTYITRANEQMQAIGYTEHGHRHAGIVSTIARSILTNLGREERDAELAAIAGYLHDMGCVVNRIGHVEAGALIAYTILTQMGMSAGEIATVIGAIGNHEEPNGVPISAVSAAVIIADKSDVHFSRVQVSDPIKFDIHDRVNYAVQKSYLRVDAATKSIILELTIDTQHASVTEYFEIFVLRMVLCHRAADFLGCKFHLNVNGVNL
ncbi:MAG: metal dependent phosphohydrolase [Capsulimonas sp.]|jgi:metal-dependent HD superfamily phosphatase/phosphodiesterase|nr:metal dependent phosphohydrolase [Capsulimonas sp.]